MFFMKQDATSRSDKLHCLPIVMSFSESLEKVQPDVEWEKTTIKTRLSDKKH